MCDTEFKKLTNTSGKRKSFQREIAVLEFTEAVAKIMNKEGIGRGRLARELSISMEEVEVLLDGNEDITIEGISDAFFVLGYGIKFSPYKLER